MDTTKVEVELINSELRFFHHPLFILSSLLSCTIPSTLPIDPHRTISPALPSLSFIRFTHPFVILTTTKYIHLQIWRQHPINPKQPRQSSSPVANNPKQGLLATSKRPSHSLLKVPRTLSSLKVSSALKTCRRYSKI